MSSEEIYRLFTDGGHILTLTEDRQIKVASQGQPPPGDILGQLKANKPAMIEFLKRFEDDLAHAFALAMISGPLK